MLKKMLRRAISFVLVFAMLCEIGTPLAYAAGNTSKKRSTLDPSMIERSYDPNNQPAGESADIKLDKEVAEVVNNTTKGDVLEASNDTVLFENTAKRDVNAKAYRLTDGSDSVFLYPVSVHEKDDKGDWIEIDNLVIGVSSNDAVKTGGYGLMPEYTYGFGEGVKAFFSWLDDALVYIW